MTPVVCETTGKAVPNRKIKVPLNIFGNGLFMCNHFLHSTCAQDVSRDLGNTMFRFTCKHGLELKTDTTGAINGEKRRAVVAHTARCVCVCDPAFGDATRYAGAKYVTDLTTRATYSNEI